MSEEIKIGEFVRSYIPKIIEYCEKNPKEFIRLQDEGYSKNTFNIDYPFFAKTSSAKRYWKNNYESLGSGIKITNHWFKSNQANFEEYLINKKLATKDEIENILHSDLVMYEYESIKSSYCGGHAIGRAQNALIRNILSNLGTKPVNIKSWEETQEYFGSKCAYCGSSGDLEIEHAIPINKAKLGEHHIGNIIPSCKECNSKKGAKTYIEYLGSDNDRIEFIKKYMADKKYVPIGDNKEITEILDQAYEDVGLVADKYIKEINEYLSGNNET